MLCKRAKIIQLTKEKRTDYAGNMDYVNQYGFLQ